MRVARYDQTHVPVDSRAGVPAQGWFGRIIHTNGQDVGGGVGCEKLGEIVAEPDEAVGPASEELAVEPDVAVHIDPVKLDDDLLAGSGRKREALPIPAGAVREIAAITLALRRRVHGTFDAPVVGHVEGAPACVVEVGPTGSRVILKVEAPAVIEGNDLSGAGGRLGSSQDGGREAEHGAEIESVQNRCEW